MNCDEGLGDLVTRSLALVGITQERVERWLNRPCKCNERRERLNQIGAWAKRVAQGKVEDAQRYLELILG